MMAIQTNLELPGAVIEAPALLASLSETRLTTAGLNDREVDALTWAARGKTSFEIACILGLSKRTIDFHVDNARAKLGAATRIEAVTKAALRRLIDP